MAIANGGGYWLPDRRSSVIFQLHGCGCASFLAWVDSGLCAHPTLPLSGRHGDWVAKLRADGGLSTRRACSNGHNESNADKWLGMLRPQASCMNSTATNCTISA